MNRGWTQSPSIGPSIALAHCFARPSGYQIACVTLEKGTLLPQYPRLRVCWAVVGGSCRQYQEGGVDITGRSLSSIIDIFSDCAATGVRVSQPLSDIRYRGSLQSNLRFCVCAHRFPYFLGAGRQVHLVFAQRAIHTSQPAVT